MANTKLDYWVPTPFQREPEHRCHCLSFQLCVQVECKIHAHFEDLTWRKKKIISLIINRLLWCQYHPHDHTLARLGATKQISKIHLIWFFFFFPGLMSLGFPGGSVVKNIPANAGDVGFDLWVGKIPGEGNGIPLQHSCLDNPMNRGAWWAPWSRRVRHDLATKQQTIPFFLHWEEVFPSPNYAPRDLSRWLDLERGALQI